MHYVISDIHGMYDQYIELLNLIDFNNNDILYVLGDVCDRGKRPIKVLQDMMYRDNVYPIVGNHDFTTLLMLKMLTQEITDDSIKSFEDNNYLEMMKIWLEDGGETTLKEFIQLDYDSRNSIIEYLGEFSLYEQITVNNRKFVLVHAGLNNFDISRSLDDYSLEEVIFERADYTKKYFTDKYLVTGHTPTQLIKENDNKGYVYQKYNHIAIDCGCVYGGRLAAICLETLEIYYVNYNEH